MTQLSNFIKTIQSFSATEKAIITVPRKWYIFSVPFPSRDKSLKPEEEAELATFCSAWSLLVKEIINDIQKRQFEGDTEGGEEKTIPEEYDWWEERAKNLKIIQQELNKPAVQRTLHILQTINPTEAEVFFSTSKIIDASLEEALDNLKFLKSIRRHVEICSNEESFAVIKATLQKVMKSLRNAWMLSKYYNTDERILRLLQKITTILLSRVCNYIKLNELQDPMLVREKATSAFQLLSEWEDRFHETRIAIEASERETRWEFSVQHIFAPIQHAKRICRDVKKAANELANLHSCFSNSLQNATQKDETLKQAQAKIEEFVKSFNDLTFDIFSDSSIHHWENHLDWFKREIRFLEVSSVSLLRDVFNELVSAKQAVLSVTEMISKGHNQFIGDAILKNISLVVKRFHQEIANSSAVFEKDKASPPISGDDVPPISGSIYWATNIMEQLDETLNHMKAINVISQTEVWKQTEASYMAFRQELESYKHSQYLEWCNKVSDILDQNLTRPLLLTFVCPDTKLRRYKVNFTADLMDTLSEVTHLENLGFSVPEVARNMSNQKAQLTQLAENLETMINEYHAAVEILEPAEIELLTNEINLVHQALRAGHVRLTWNNLAVQESCLDIGSRSISVFKSKMQQVNLIRKELASSVQAIREGNMFL